MKIKIKALITLVRLPNLVFIFLTQILIYYKIVNADRDYFFTKENIILFALSTTCIAAAGYIINDYFDIKIDEINKPERVTIELQFKRRWIMLAHVLLNILALALVYPIALQASIYFLSIQLLSIFLLIIYSSYLKRKAFLGNITVAFLNFTTVWMIGFYVNGFIVFDLSANGNMLLWFYALFAFVLTWVREIIKDLEDFKGDEAQGCTTMPIQFGINFSKKFTTVLLLLAILLCLLSYSFLPFLLIVVLLLAVIIPLVFCLFFLQKCSLQSQYAQLSFIIKLITFLGILSILLL